MEENNIGKNIAAMRKRLDITQEELAKRVGYKSKSTINKIELGVNDIPQSKIVKFADALGTTPAVLMGWEEMEKENDALSDIIIRMRTDENFFSLVRVLFSLDSAKIASVRQFLNTFLK